MESKKLINFIKNRSAEIMFILSLILATLSVFSLSKESSIFANADTFYLPTIYKGLFVEHFPFSTWKFAYSPFFFPDLLIFSFVACFIKNLIISNFLTSSIIFTLIFYWSYRICFRFSRDKKTSLTLLSIFVFLISSGALLLHKIFLMAPVFHGGEILITLVLIDLVLTIIVKEKFYLYLVYFFLLLLITFSDRLIIKDFTGPLLLCFAFLMFTRARKNREKIYKLTGITLAATFLGSILYKAFVPYAKNITGPYPLYLENIRNIFTDFVSFFTKGYLTLSGDTNDLGFLNTMGSFMLLVILSYVIAIKHLKKHIDDNNTIEFFYTTFILCQFVCVITITSLFGYYQNLSHSRYLASILFFPILWLIAFEGRKLTRYYTLIFIILGILLTLQTYGLWKNKLGIPVPENVRCLDEIAQKESIRYGLAEYWNAGQISNFSKTGLKVMTITKSGGYITPFHWLNSYEQFVKTSDGTEDFPNYSFVLTKDISEETIKNTLGEPDSKYSCESTDVLIYSPEKIKPILEGMFRAKYFFSFLKIPGDKMSIDPNYLEYYILDKSVEGQQPSSDKRFTTKVGPIITLEKGKFKISVKYSAIGENPGAVSFQMSPPNQVLTYPLENTQGSKTTMETFIEIGKNFRELTMNSYNAGILKTIIYYSTSGTVTIDGFTIERIN